MGSSPDADDANPDERNRSEPEIEPSAVGARVLGHDEELNTDPDTDRQAQSEPDQVPRRLIDGPNRRALREADSEDHDDQRCNEYYAQERTQHPLAWGNPGPRGLCAGGIMPPLPLIRANRHPRHGFPPTLDQEPFSRALI